jgi:hypothetical protein
MSAQNNNLESLIKTACESDVICALFIPAKYINSSELLSNHNIIPVSVSSAQTNTHAALLAGLKHNSDAPMEQPRPQNRPAVKTLPSLTGMTANISAHGRQKPASKIAKKRRNTPKKKQVRTSCPKSKWSEAENIALRSLIAQYGLISFETIPLGIYKTIHDKMLAANIGYNRSYNATKSHISRVIHGHKGRNRA